MQPCRVGVLISGSGSNLQAIIDHSRLPGSGYSIVAVISNKADAAGLAKAQSAGIDTCTIDHRCFPDRESFDLAVDNCLQGFRVDLVVLAGFMRILSTDFVASFRGRLLNIHPSLLPKYPGLNTHQRAIDANDTEAGCTVHFVTEELDGGPPIAQARVPVLATDDASTLASRVLIEEHRIYPLVVQWFAAGRLQLQNNNALLDDKLLLSEGQLL